jgi:hypothetical protein
VFNIRANNLLTNLANTRINNHKKLQAFAKNIECIRTVIESNLNKPYCPPIELFKEWKPINIITFGTEIN